MLHCELLYPYTFTLCYTFYSKIIGNLLFAGVRVVEYTERNNIAKRMYSGSRFSRRYLVIPGHQYRNERPAHSASPCTPLFISLLLINIHEPPCYRLSTGADKATIPYNNGTVVPVAVWQVRLRTAISEATAAWRFTNFVLYCIVLYIRIGLLHFTLLYFAC